MIKLLLKVSKESGGCCAKSGNRTLYAVCDIDIDVEGNVILRNVSAFKRNLLDLAKVAGKWENTITEYNLHNNQSFMDQLNNTKKLKNGMRIVE